MPEIKEHELPELPEPDAVIVLGTQALRGFTAETMHSYATEAIKELKGRLEEAEMDAARYRWLRENHEVDGEVGDVRRWICTDMYLGLQGGLGEQLDAAIDRALSLEGGGET